MIPSDTFQGLTFYRANPLAIGSWGLEFDGFTDRQMVLALTALKIEEVYGQMIPNSDRRWFMWGSLRRAIVESGVIDSPAEALEWLIEAKFIRAVTKQTSSTYSYYTPRHALELQANHLEEYCPPESPWSASVRSLIETRTTNLFSDLELDIAIDIVQINRQIPRGPQIEAAIAAWKAQNRSGATTSANSVKSSEN
jgi:hypothetical protein